MTAWCARERSYFPDSEFEPGADGNLIHRIEPRHWAVSGALIDIPELGPGPTDMMEDPDSTDGMNDAE